jgi:REP element-mobilizing transposase RayT
MATHNRNKQVARTVSRASARRTPRARRPGSRSKRATQGELFARTWGGPRQGSGRKRRASRKQVEHRTRASFRGARPVHVTVRLVEGLPSLRERAAYRALVAALGAASERFGQRVVHWSVLSNHLHLLVEAADREALSRGMQGLGVRIARALNRLWRRRGSVLADRYHAHVLNSPKEVRTALVYVLHNARKHKAIAAGLDAYSSAWWFDGWLGGAPPSRAAIERPAWLRRARTWLFAHGWRRWGPIEVEDSS